MRDASPRRLHARELRAHRATRSRCGDKNKSTQLQNIKAAVRPRIKIIKTRSLSEQQTHDYLSLIRARLPIYLGLERLLQVRRRVSPRKDSRILSRLRVHDTLRALQICSLARPRRPI